MRTKMKVFTIYDLKAGVHGRPFFLQSTGVAMRIFADMVNDREELVCRHPEDFILYDLGEFDEDTGMFQQDAGAKSICNGIELKVFEPEPPAQIDLEDAIKEGLKPSIRPIDEGKHNGS